MFTKSCNNKVKFQDQQLDDYVLENSVLKSKLQSKIDALSIMSKELDKCSMERDRYKVLVEQLKCKKLVPFQDNSNSTYKFNLTNTIPGGDMLARTREHNNVLKLEVESLRSKLEEATGDIEALRKQLQNKETVYQDVNGSKKISIFHTYSNKDYEQLVQELERVQKKYQQIQLDYRATLDEKEELVSDRDYYKNKVQRLNNQISYILSNTMKAHQTTDKDVDPPKPIVDIDAVVTENKYLHERMLQLQIEKEIVKKTLTKYKTLLENRNKTDPFTLKRGLGDVMTQKQVREFLDISSKSGLKKTSAAELKSLCLGLFEALNDKSIALQHQRKTNQILANRITELEKTLESWCKGQKYLPIFPSQMLLDEFLPDTASTKSEDSKSKHLNEQDDLDSIKIKCEIDDEVKENSDSSSDLRSNCEDCGSEFNSNLNEGTKTILPLELEELVKEALAELKPVN